MRQLSVKEQELLNQIHHAFARVTLGDGVSLNMTEFNDSGGSQPIFAEMAKNDERNNWTKIPGETLVKFTVTFSFTDLQGFRFYIPAYMSWTIRNHQLSDSIIADHTIYAIDPSHYLFETIPFWDWFTEKQIAAMVEFLEYAMDNPESLDAGIAKDNLAKIKKGPQNGS